MCEVRRWLPRLPGRASLLAAAVQLTSRPVEKLLAYKLFSGVVDQLTGSLVDVLTSLLADLLIS